MIDSIAICRDEADQKADDKFVSELLRGNSDAGGSGGGSVIDELLSIGERERILYLNCLRENAVPESCPMAH
ncbi:MAG: hypothetical protein AAF563_10540 [Pseudomonadota bacterium]